MSHTANEIWGESCGSLLLDWPSPTEPEVNEVFPDPKPEDKKTLKQRILGAAGWRKSDPLPPVDEPRIIISDLTRLLAGDIYDDYVLKPTPGAYSSAKKFATEVHQQMEQGLPRPRVAPDGNGGIIMEWRNQRGVIKLGFASTGNDADNYIFYMNGELYRTIEATVENLIERLEWLNHE